jgi:XTP/dITP diphosphohydrolase
VTSPLVWASSNAGKVREVGEILAAFGPGAEILPFRGEMPPETGSSYAANALIKARHASASDRLPALADDSGLEVIALRGEPGVRSARYAPDDRARVDRLLRETRNAPDRGARFVAAVALVLPGGATFIVESDCPGELVPEPRGDEGFGYDPVFVPRGETRTFAEMSREEKNRLSHRGQALWGMDQILRIVVESRVSVHKIGRCGCALRSVHGRCLG